MAAIALECFLTWDEPTFIATAVVWGTATILTSLCVLTLWEGEFLRDGLRVLRNKIINFGAAGGSHSSNEVVEGHTLAVEVVVGTKE